MKNAIIRVLKSNAYRERNRDPQKCYDHAEGVQPDDRPPCRVAYILQKNCVQCHDSAYSGDGNLNLGAWIDAADGKSKTFPHLDDALGQVSARETLAQFVERISSSDPKKRMPKNKLMSSPERQELFLWAQQELSRLRQEEVAQ
jgi:mono/diheme cytochrome c family protein